MRPALNFCLFAASAVCLTGQTASIAGKIITENNLPVVKAIVHVVKRGLPPVSVSSLTDARGDFLISKLPAGTFSVCVQPAVSGLLDPCQWNMATLQVTLAEGQSSKGNTMMMKSGSVAKLRIEDPLQMLSQKTKDGRTPDISSGVWTIGGKKLSNGTVMGGGPAFHQMRPVSKDATGTNYEITVPRDLPLNLHVLSNDLTLGDSKGAALPDAALKEQFQHNTGDRNPKNFVYTIVGLKR